MWHKLAMRLGCTVRETQQRIGSREFAEWAAFDRMSPIGDERIDYLFAHLISHVRAAMYSGKRKRMWRLRSFLLHWWRKPRPTQEQLHAKLLAFFATHNEKVKRGASRKNPRGQRPS